MYKLLYPTKDTTIYEKQPEANSGVDQILEITKYTPGESYLDVTDQYASWDTPYNSRILIQFDIDEISAKILAGTIDPLTAKYYLNLKSSEAASLSTEYVLYAYPIGESWINGNGGHDDNPIITNGASWKYRNSKFDGIEWDSSSFDTAYATTKGGANWDSQYAASQSFSMESPDVRMDITNIVNAWLQNDIPNNGLIIKHSTAAESDAVIYGSLKFFSRESHTIYLPKLETYWRSYTDFAGTFASSPIATSDAIVYIKNLKNKYKVNEKVKLKIGIREKYPTKTYTNSIRNVTEHKFPATTYYSVIDSITNIPIVEFDTVGTQVEMDANGHYVILDLTNFLPVRYYKIIFKVVDGDTEYIIDNDFNFRVEK